MAVPERRSSFGDLLGIAKGDGETPDDATVRDWINAHRMEKYGR